MKAFTIRLIPGDNLQDKLKEFIQKEKLSSGNVYCMIPACGMHLFMHLVPPQIMMNSAFIITCVGSLTKAVMRMANSVTLKTFEGLDSMS